MAITVQLTLKFSQNSPRSLNICCKFIIADNVIDFT